MGHLRITTSWDDGHPHDLRVAELLQKYDIGATFYIPCRNCEKRPVLQHTELQELGKAFEIGGHTKDHLELTYLQTDEVMRQVVDGKRCLEDILGRSIKGFCYPRGGYNEAIKYQVRAAGFEYGRTIKNFFVAPSSDPFEIPTTIQVYPHRSVTLLKNFLKHRAYSSRAALFLSAIGTSSMTENLISLAEICRVRGGIFHVWGHSWELDEFDLWTPLEEAFKQLAGSFERIETGPNHAFYGGNFAENNNALADSTCP